MYRGSQLNDRLALTSASYHSYSIVPCKGTLFCTVQSSSENNLDSPQPVGTPFSKKNLQFCNHPHLDDRPLGGRRPTLPQIPLFPSMTRLHSGVSKLPCWICFPKKKRSFRRDPDSTDPIPHTGSLSSPKMCSTPSSLFPIGLHLSPSWTLMAHPHPPTPSCITCPALPELRNHAVAFTRLDRPF